MSWDMLCRQVVFAKTNSQYCLQKIRVEHCILCGTLPGSHVDPNIAKSSLFVIVH